LPPAVHDQSHQVQSTASSPSSTSKTKKKKNSDEFADFLLADLNWYRNRKKNNDEDKDKDRYRDQDGDEKCNDMIAVRSPAPSVPPDSTIVVDRQPDPQPDSLAQAEANLALGLLHGTPERELVQPVVVSSNSGIVTSEMNHQSLDVGTKDTEGSVPPGLPQSDIVVSESAADSATNLEESSASLDLSSAANRNKSLVSEAIPTSPEDVIMSNSEDVCPHVLDGPALLGSLPHVVSSSQDKLEAPEVIGEVQVKGMINVSLAITLCDCFIICNPEQSF
jgi:hypothetical protein